MNQSANHLEELAVEALRLARERGATDAECTLSAGDEFTTNVRMGEVESLKESGSRGVGIRVLKGRHTGSSFTSDLSGEGLRRMVQSALDLAAITGEDPHAGLPEPEELGQLGADLRLYSDDVMALETSRKIELARETERAALDFDARIVNSEGASFDSHVGQRVFANSRGFLGSYRATQCSLSTVPVARQGDTMERDYWYSAARGFAALEKPADIGRIAAQRVLRRLGARKVPTQKASVVFEPRTARTLLDHVFEAVHGESVYRRASFLAGKLGHKIASERLTVIDDATLPGLFGSSPFDDEGVPTRRTPVIERGVLSSYLLNTYTARKLGLKTTGNASRGLSGNAGISHGNLFAEAGAVAPAEIIKSVRRGLFVTELIGFGVNIVTGDYSRGAAGIWIENGEFTYPVSEVTIAGNLAEMFASIEMIASDLEFRGSTAAPTLLVGEMTISGS